MFLCVSNTISENTYEGSIPRNFAQQCYFTMAIKDQVNSILAKYHTIAVLAYDRIPLPGHADLSQSDMMIAVGFNFLSMNYLTVTAVPSPSASPDSLEQIVQATAVLNC